MCDHPLQADHIAEISVILRKQSKYKEKSKRRIVFHFSGEEYTMLEKRSVFTVSTYQCNADGNIHIHSLMQQLQEIASKHAEDLGVGRKWMNKNEFFWVLVNFRMEIKRHPRYEETVLLKTWPSGWDLLKAFRDFKGEDLEGKELFSATSDWMVIDKKTYRPMTTKELNFDFEFTNNRVIEDPQRLKDIPDMEERGNITVPYSSIDMNGHVNNTEYIRWGIDALQNVQTFDKRISSFNISYLAEVFKDEVIKISTKNLGPHRILIKGNKEGSVKPVFVIEVEMY